MFKSLTIRQKEILTGVCILTIVFGSVIGGEALLRLRQILAFGSAQSVEKMDAFYIHEETGLRLPVPGAKMGRIEFNKDGYRGPTLSDNPPVNVIRVGFMGSSIVFDPYIANYESTWSHLLTAKLQELYPACKFEYFNAGLPGVGTHLIQTYYDNLIVHSSPDVLIIMSDDSAHRLDELAIETGTHDGVHYRPSWLAEHSLFWGKVEKNAVIQQRLRQADSEEGKLVFTREQLTSQYEEHIRNLLRSIKSQDDVPVLLSFGQKIRRDQGAAEKLAAANTAFFYLPYVSIEGLLNTADWYNESNALLAEELQVSYLQWHDQIPGTTEFFVDSRHFTQAGSAKVADVLGQQLQDSVRFRQQLARHHSCASN